MLVLDISLDLGAGTTPYQLEALVKAVRVAADVGSRAEDLKARRAAAESMKFPTDRELRSALERLPGGDEYGPRFLAQRHLEIRDQLANDARRMPPDIWFDFWHSRRSKSFRNLSGTGFERAIANAPGPWALGALPGLDVLEPVLYRALLADQLQRDTADQIVVRSLRFSNPFGQVITGAGEAEQAIRATANAIETAATLGSRRKIKKAEARVAEATTDDRIEESRLDRDLKREQVRKARIDNAMAEEELLAKRIENAQALQSLSPTSVRQLLIEHFVAAGELDQADVLADSDPSDAGSLLQFALRPPQLELEYEPDED